MRALEFKDGMTMNSLATAFEKMWDLLLGVQLLRTDSLLYQAFIHEEQMKNEARTTIMRGSLLILGQLAHNQLEKYSEIMIVAELMKIIVSHWPAWNGNWVACFEHIGVELSALYTRTNGARMIFARSIYASARACACCRSNSLPTAATTCTELARQLVASPASSIAARVASICPGANSGASANPVRRPIRGIRCRHSRIPVPLQ